MLFNVYNISGQLVETLINEYKESGNHQVKWNASLHSSGMYFIELKVHDNIFNKKVILMK